MSKRRRVQPELGIRDLQELLHRGSISINGLSDLLAHLQGPGELAPETIRKQLMGANMHHFNTAKCTIHLPLIAGGSWAWEFIDPGALLDAMLAASPSFRAVFQRAWDTRAPSVAAPWSLVVAFDEFIPGNKLAVEHARKSMVLSFSFRELGQDVLSLGSCWCTAVVVRSSKIAEVHAL